MNFRFQVCTNRTTIIGIIIYIDFQNGGANVTHLTLDLLDEIFMTEK